jgi:hypothetical protein
MSFSVVGSKEKERNTAAPGFYGARVIAKGQTAAAAPCSNWLCTKKSNTVAKETYRFQQQERPTWLREWNTVKRNLTNTLTNTHYISFYF